MNKNKEITSILNTLENHCETFYKQLDVEIDKASHNEHKNPKHLDLLMTNLKIDIDQTLEKLQVHIPSFYEAIKGDLASYEKTASQLIDSYKVDPNRSDASAVFDFLKTLQDKKAELRTRLDQIFLKIRNEFSL